MSAPARPNIPLQAGEFRLKLTVQEREILHLILDLVRERPEALVEDAAGTPAAMVMLNHVARIKNKLPPRGAGTY